MKLLRGASLGKVHRQHMRNAAGTAEARCQFFEPMSRSRHQHKLCPACGQGFGQGSSDTG
jgi:hypothetical protein